MQALVSTMRARTAVIGLGNILLGDDGVGVRVVEWLEAEGGLAGVDLIDAGTSAFDTLDIFLTHERIVLVDALRGGHEPGFIYMLSPKDLANGQSFEVSLHDTHVVELARLAERMGARPEVILVGIEPERIRLSLELSPTIVDELPNLMEIVRRAAHASPAHQSRTRA